MGKKDKKNDAKNKGKNKNDKKSKDELSMKDLDKASGGVYSPGGSGSNKPSPQHHHESQP